MTTTRRDFLAQASLAAGALAVAPSALAAQRRSKKLKLLILGGTGFLGPHIVWDALERGYEVTLFNRGRTDPGLFPDVETLIGDRYSDYSALEQAVADGRTWDGVIDTFTYVPGIVEDAINALGEQAIGHYVVVSTTSVYASSNEPGADESAPLAQVADDVAAGIKTHREVGMHYGAMKARCEQAAERLLPGKVASPRPGLICGARDTTGRFSYWPIRAAEGGTMIAPGTPNDPMQIIDVRDLAAFIIRLVEDRSTGAFNAITPPREVTMGSVVKECIAAADAGTEHEWIDAAFLAANGVQAWQHMPAWVPPTTPGYAGFGLAGTDRSQKAGLTCRPVSETAKAVLEYYRSRPALLAEREGDGFDRAQWERRIRGGLDPQREAEVLKAWFDREQS